ncbi:MAG: FAD-binding protein [Bacteroidetes bacterium]|nr:FAD-binding protein [Bacteroidota bacterium]
MEQHIGFFNSILRANAVIIEHEALKDYAKDCTEDLEYIPQVALLPSTAEQVSKIMAYCYEHNLPVTPRGAGTGLSGGALPVNGGVVISCKNLNQILDINTDAFQATVEPGVINEVFQNACKEKGLFYPPDPASKGSCFMGGNLAENSGGPKAVKYGTTKDYVLNLEVVLPNGEMIWTGANVLKNATGYNLTQLVCGSEGTLGFITKIVVRLLPYPKENLLLLASFNDIATPCRAVNAILKAGITPSGLEYMERNAVDWSMRFADISLDLAAETEAILLVEVDGNNLETLYQDVEQINGILEEYDCSNVFFAESDLEKERLWKVRRVCGEAVHSHSIYKEEDTVVPRNHLPELLTSVKAIGKQFGFESVCYGHAGDGNLHVNILKGEMDDEAWNKTVKLGIREIFEVCKNLGGTISGEHGIGLVQREYMDVVFSVTQLELMRSIKKVFDPKGLMNPGKIF